MPGAGTIHAEQVHQSVRYGPSRVQAPVDNDERLFRSWKRSLEAYRLDPGRAAKPRILTGPALRDHQDAMERFLRIARHGVRQLHAQVRDANYVVLLTDGKGVTIDFRGDPVWDRDLKRAGLYLGSCWSEQEEGTCGVGTAIIDRSAITVHKGEHFRSPNITLTCSAAPVMDAQGHLLAILDASALYSPDDKKSQALVLQFVRQYALMIEDAYFLDSHREAWVVQMASSREFLKVQTECLLAVDDLGRVIAANRRAKTEIPALEDLPRPLGDLFDCGVETLARAAETGVLLPLHDARGARTYYAQVRGGLAAGVRTPRGEVSSPDHGAPVLRAMTPIDVIAGQDERMLANAARAKQILNAPIPLLLLGETGTGKEAFAKAIHASSKRAGKPFVAVNCAAIPDTLIESELFGYAEGAFTGARARGSRGRLLQADGGTLFLDEVGDMPLALQSRLLRVLAEGEVQPLGEVRTLRVDLRVICATHRDLGALMETAHFRADLFYRLAGATFVLPALRERQDGAGLLTAILAEEAAAQDKSVGISNELAATMMQCPWPGNIRQLRNAVRYAVSVCSGAFLRLEDFPPQAGLPTPGGMDVGGFQAAARDIGDAFEAPAGDVDQRLFIITALRRHGWRVPAAAADLGLSRATLYRRIKQFGIVSPNREGA